MRTLDDEADALRDVREHVVKAMRALPDCPWPVSQIETHWSAIDYALDEVKHSIDRALKEIGA